MPSPLHGRRPPFTLPSNVVYFHDWRYVYTGGFRWVSGDVSDNRLCAESYTLDAIPSGMRMEYQDMPLGIHLAAQRANRTEPVLGPGQLAENSHWGGTLIHEDGRYRLWYECWPRETYGTSRINKFDHLRYAESENGVDWTLPSLGLHEFRGKHDNNIVIAGSLIGERGFLYASVFKDPSAPPEERYKLVHLGQISPEEFDKYRRERPNDVDPWVLGPPPRHEALFGAVSPDGLSWTALPDPLVVQFSDTHNVCTYDSVRGKYVFYCRSWYFEKRTIGRMESADFRHFPLPEELFWPNALMQPYDVWYGNAKTMMPGTTDYHVMFPMRWNLPADTFDFHLATSPDGIVWGFAPGGPVCEPGEPGSWDSGLVMPGVGLVDLPGERTGLLVSGWPVPHKYPRNPNIGAYGWAWWPKGRLVALEAPLEGSFALYPLQFRGRTARLNFSTTLAGYVRVEACGPDGAVIPGRGFDDCDVLTGNHLDRPVTWHGVADLGHAEGAPVTLRFKLRGAQLFAVRFE